MDGISGFLTYVYTMPSALFSIPFTALFLYWCVSAIIGNLDFDFDSDIDSDVFGKLIVSLGMSKVPLSIGFTIVFGLGTIITFLIESLLIHSFVNYGGTISDYFSLGNIVVSVIVYPIVLFFSMYLTGKIIYITRMEKLFGNDERLELDYKGQVVTVMSSVVNERSGTGIFIDHRGYEHQVHIITTNNEEFEKGKKVIIIDEIGNDPKKYVVSSDVL